MSKIMFRSEVELGKFLGSVDIIPDSYRSILETNLTYELHTTRSGIDVLAFKCSFDYDYTSSFLEEEMELVSSDKPHVLDFISTKVNSSFCVNKVAAELFQNLGDDLKELENKYVNSSLIITGSGLGGYLAIFSTLRLHHAIDVEESNGSKKTKRPICITFGSPLVGDESLQRAIAERPQWKYSFLNVVANKDGVASSFASKTSYKPFGTFLFCTESGGHTAFEDEHSILLVLDAMKSSNASNLQVYGYMNVLNSMRRKVLYRGVSELGAFNLNVLKGGITLQMSEIGVLHHISNDQIELIERQTKLMKRKKNPYEPTKKLNEMKISLTYMEWYMKKNRLANGYYDSYKNATSRKEIVSQHEILKRKRELSKYWKEFVEEKDKMPQKEGAKLRKRWLYGGTNFRRIVEPLEIGEYYKNGNTNYVKNREDHYKLLEKWFDEDMKDSKTREETRTKAASLTEDSCFWAYVEEALISLRNLKSGGSSNIEEELKQFEDYVMSAIKSYSVSPEIFVKGSSLMKWWDEYKAHKGSAYASEFAQFMNNGSYMSYE